MAKSFPSPLSVWLLPVIYLTHSYNPAYPKDIVEYPPCNNGCMLAPFGNLANAPCCHSIGAISLVAFASLSCLACKALWQSSSLSSYIFQNFFKSFPDDKATSTKLIVTTP